MTAQHPHRTAPRAGARAPRAALAAAARGALALGAGIGLALGTALGVAAPAAAHDALISSSPAEDEVLTTSPAEIRLTFSDDALPITPQIVVAPEGGPPGEARAATVDGRDVHLPLAEPLDEGTYRVSWSVVSSDGHRIEGTYLFGLDTDGDGVVTSTARPTNPATAATSGATPSATEADDPADATPDTGAAEEGSGTSPLPWIAGIAALGVVGAVLAVALRRGRAR